LDELYFFISDRTVYIWTFVCKIDNNLLFPQWHHYLLLKKSEIASDYTWKACSDFRSNHIYDAENQYPSFLSFPNCKAIFIILLFIRSQKLSSHIMLNSYESVVIHFVDTIVFRALTFVIVDREISIQWSLAQNKEC
jgi:hypothetical protein